MAQLFVATIRTAQGPTPAVVRDGFVEPIAGVASVRAMLEDWDEWLVRLDGGPTGESLPVADCTFLAPVPEPANLYMAGANYSDHIREMSKLGPDDPVPRPQSGPFFFLKPTTAIVADREPVVIGEGVERLDWEVELAAVIGRRADRVSESAALEHVAAYTIVNDISARDRFVREGMAPTFTFDWLAQKGRATSCPMGPWLLPARDCRDPGRLDLRLSVNGELMQNSNTSQMLFALEEQIAFLSRIIPLVPGDIVATGTPAGVGAGRGRFLAGGDTMRAEIEHIGALVNPVVEA